MEIKHYLYGDGVLFIQPTLEGERVYIGACAYVPRGENRGKEMRESTLHNYYLCILDVVCMYVKRGRRKSFVVLVFEIVHTLCASVKSKVRPLPW